MNSKNDSFVGIASVLKDFKGDQDKYIAHEFQKYGYELARELGDLKRVSFYIKLAKQEPRGFLESAKNFVKDANNVKSPPKLFLWRLTQLKNEAKEKKQK